MEQTDICRELTNADMVLVGLGEEFDGERQLQSCEEYINGVQWLKDKALYSLLPAWNEFCMEKQQYSAVSEALERLRELLGDKNYFVVSVAMNSEIAKTAWRDGRLVMPCGSTVKLQCEKSCEGILGEVPEETKVRLRTGFEALYNNAKGLSAVRLSDMGACVSCGARMVFNNIYAENYNENGYLEQWQLYTRWLQGTVNRRLLVLELGVGMRFPSVIRWPFEKAAYFNRKAFFCRVNERLYQLTEELSGKGAGISQNAIDWLSRL